MTNSAPEHSAKLPEKDIACDEIVEVVELPSQNSVRDIVEASFANARQKLALSRARKIRENLAKAAPDDTPDASDDDEASSARAGVVSSHQKTSADRPRKAAFSIPTWEKPRRVKKVHTPPPGLAWVRVQTNVAVPEKYEHDFHVPYLGESDAKVKSSNTLAMDLFQQDLDEEGDNSEIEEYSDQLVFPDDDAVHIPAGDKSNTSKKALRSSSRSKGPSSAKKSLLKERTKEAMPLWDRAAKRVALKDTVDRLRIDTTESINDVVCDVLRLRHPKYVAGYHTNVTTRARLWEKHDEEEFGKKERHAEVVQHARKEMTTCAWEVLKSESITFFVCRQCYTYVCSMHGYQNDARPVKKPMDKSKKAFLTPQGVAEIEAKCEDHESGSCWFQMGDRDDAEQWYSEVKSHSAQWKDIQAILRELFDTLGHDPCRICSMLKSFVAHISAKVHFTCSRVGYLCREMFSLDSDAKEAMRNNARPRKPQSKWSRSRVRRPAQEIESMQGGKRLDYVPCRHEGPCTRNNCICVQSGLLCEKFCGCNHNHVQHGRSQVTCNNAYRGCSCKSTAACASKACICFSMNRECDPDLCRQCHECKGDSFPNGKRGSCLNEGLRMNEKHRTVVGYSEVHGWGVFAVDDIPKNAIIGEYVGELIKQEEAERRGRVYDEINYSFLFNTTNDYALDSTRLGNKLRYCNHSSRPNCEPKVMRVGGDVRVGLYAKRNITRNEEIFFNYGYNDGPAWAMQGQSKNGSSGKKRTAKMASVSDGESDEVLPVSSRQRKSSDDEEVLIACEPTSELEYPATSQVPRKLKRIKKEEPLTPPKTSLDHGVLQTDDIFVPCDEADAASLTNDTRMPLKEAVPSVTGRSVWRGILKRLSVGAADVESPARRHSKESRFAGNSPTIPNLDLGRNPPRSREGLELGEVARIEAVSARVSGGGAYSSERRMKGAREIDRLPKGHDDHITQKTASLEKEPAEDDIADNIHPKGAKDLPGHRNGMREEDRAALREVFGSDCELDSDVGVPQHADDIEPKASNTAERSNGVHQNSHPSLQLHNDGPHAMSLVGTADRYEVKKAGVSDGSANWKPTKVGGLNKYSDVAAKKRPRPPTPLDEASPPLGSHFEDWTQNGAKDSKRPRLPENGQQASSILANSDAGGSLHRKKPSLLKANGLLSSNGHRERVSPAKRRLFEQCTEPQPLGKNVTRESQYHISALPRSQSRADPSSSVKRRKGDNGQSGSSDDEGMGEVVPVVNLISDEDDEGGRKGSCEATFRNWFT